MLTTSVSRIWRSWASTSGLGSLRNPAANWCSRRRISSAAAMKAAACSSVPPDCNCTCCSVCSSTRAISDNAVKPTVAELPASECDKATAVSGSGSCSSSAHSCKQVTRRRDHSSASFRYTLYSGMPMRSVSMTLTASSLPPSSCGKASSRFATSCAGSASARSSGKASGLASATSSGAGACSAAASADSASSSFSSSATSSASKPSEGMLASVATPVSGSAASSTRSSGSRNSSPRASAGTSSGASTGSA